jgi:hypothetical protein
MPSDDAEKPMRLTDEAVEALVDLIGGKLKNGSPEADDAWRVLSSCYRNPASVEPGVWTLLANATDPDMRDSVPVWFEIKRARRASREIGDREIAEFIWRRVMEAGWKRDAAYQKAVETFHVGYRTAEKAFAQWEPIYKELGSRLKMLTRMYASSALDKAPPSGKKKPS